MEENQFVEYPKHTTRDINSLIVKSISDPIIVMNRDFCYIYVNKAAEKLIGRKEIELLGNNIFEFYSFLSGSSLEISCKKALTEQHYIFLEQYYPNFDAWAEFHIIPNEEGIVIHFKNITATKKRENEALKLIKRNALIIETMRDMFILTDEQFNVVDVNPAFCETLGYTKKEILKMNVHDFDTETSTETIRKKIKNALKSNVAFIDTKNKTKNGEILDIELTLLELVIDGKTHFASFGRNVTEFKNAQKELNKTNLRFELIGTATQEALWEVDLKTEKRWANEVHQNMYGLSKADPVPASMPWQNRINTNERERVIGSLEKAILDKKTTWNEEYLFLTENNGWITVYDRTHIIYDQDGNAIRMLGSMTNITDLKKAEIAIKAEKELSDSIINSLPGIFYLINREGKFLRWNENFEKISGYNNAELKAIYALDLFAEDEKELLRRKIIEVFEKGESEIEANIFTKENQKIPYYLNGRLTSKNGVKCLIGMGVDMTEKKKAEKALHEMEEKILLQKVQHQKKIARAIIKTQETQRNHIGAELHDNVNQLLAGARIYLSIAGKKEEKIQEAIQYPMELLDNAINEIRILTAKHVSPLKEVNLENLVKSLVENLQQATGLKVSLSYEVSQNNIPGDQRLNIYRILQELFNNILKHSNCTEATVAIKTCENFILIKVEDNGKGFSLNEKREGIGLSNITNRVDSFNGEVAFKSEPGKGCSTIINIPLFNNPNEF